jgi:DNA-binding transcriptional MerR regulator
MANKNTYEDAEQLMTSQVGRLLGLSAQMVRRLADEGRLPCTRIAGLRIFTRRDALHLLEQRSADVT